MFSFKQSYLRQDASAVASPNKSQKHNSQPVGLNPQQSKILELEQLLQSREAYIEKSKLEWSQLTNRYKQELQSKQDTIQSLRQQLTWALEDCNKHKASKQQLPPRQNPSILRAKSHTEDEIKKDPNAAQKSPLQKTKSYQQEHDENQSPYQLSLRRFKSPQLLEKYTSNRIHDKNHLNSETSLHKTPPRMNFTPPLSVNSSSDSVGAAPTSQKSMEDCSTQVQTDMFSCIQKSQQRGISLDRILLQQQISSNSTIFSYESQIRDLKQKLRSAQEALDSCEKDRQEIAEYYRHISKKIQIRLKSGQNVQPQKLALLVRIKQLEECNQKLKDDNIKSAKQMYSEYKKLAKEVLKKSNKNNK